MIGRLKKIWKAAPVATALLALAVVVGIGFGIRSATMWSHWSDPGNRDQVIQHWMTPGYVAHSWHVPRDVVLDAINAPTGKDAKRRNFDQLAEFLGTTPDALMTKAQDAINAYRAENPPRDAGKSKDK